MKRATMLAVALVIAGTCGFAQTPVGRRAQPVGGRAQPVGGKKAQATVGKSAETGIALPQTISARDPRIKYSGRWDTSDGKHPKCSWSGCAVTVMLQGTQLNAKISTGKPNWVEVLVDGESVGNIAITPGEPRWYRVVENLAPGKTHTIMLVRRVEACYGGNLGIAGWQIDRDAKLLQVPPAKRALFFIGDSITCGFGNEAKGGREPFRAEEENGAAAFGFLTALELNADYYAAAWSGRKLWPDNSMLDVYERTLAFSPEKWNTKKEPVPDAILINLGTNDFNFKPNPEEEGWVKAYIGLIKDLRRDYPKARIYCCEGPMLGGEWRDKCRNWIKRAVKESGDTNTTTVFFDYDKKDGFGAYAHPSLAAHQRMAKKLVPILKRELRWQ